MNTSTKKNRTEILYDIYEYIYREPQHIGRMKNPDSKYKNFQDALKHLKNMEVTLNQLFNIFFTFLPSQLLHQFLEIALKTPLRVDEYELFIRDMSQVIEHNDLGNITQADLFFVGSKNTVSIEMKIGAKSSLDQLMKYALLHCLEQDKNNQQKQHHLIYLGKGLFKNQWNEKFETIDDLKKAFREYQLPDSSKNKKLDYTPYKDRLYKMVDTMSIGYINYEDMKSYCENMIPFVEHNIQMKKMLTGLVDELEERQLVEG